MQTPHSFIAGLSIKRAAILEMSFVNEAACDTAKAFYAELLGTQPGSTKAPYLFVLPVEMALVLEISADGLAHSTTYWELQDNSSANFANVYKDLKDKHRCTHIKGPHKPSYKSLLKPDTEVCTLLDPSGTAFGLVINPPIPMLRSKQP